MTTDFASFWDEKESSDVEIVFDGDKKIHGHKIILAAASPVFRRRFFGGSAVMKDEPVDMKGHCDLFARLVYGVAGEKFTLADYPALIDAIDLADFYDASGVLKEINTKYREWTGCPIDKNRAEFARLWTHWNVPHLVFIYETSLKFGVRELIRLGEPLSEDAALFALDNCLFEEKKCVAMLYDMWKKKKILFEVEERLKKVIMGATCDILGEIYVEHEREMKNPKTRDEFLHTLHCMILDKKFLALRNTKRVSTCIKGAALARKEIAEKRKRSE